MKRSILMSILILIFLPYIVFSQTRKIRIKDLNLKNTYEEISILKSNEDIKEGSYNRIIRGNLSVNGNYKNNERIGVWNIYNFDNKVEIEIDYNSGFIKYLTIDSISKQEIMKESSIQTNDDRPVLLISSSNALKYLNALVKYPEYAQENAISGKVIISVQVDYKGNITKYIVSTSIDKSLDDESIRVVKLLPLEFLPAFKNGKPIDSEFKIPVNFRIEY